jgi:hypothetical protein
MKLIRTRTYPGLIHSRLYPVLTHCHRKEHSAAIIYYLYEDIGRLLCLAYTVIYNYYEKICCSNFPKEKSICVNLNQYSKFHVFYIFRYSLDHCPQYIHFLCSLLIPYWTSLGVLRRTSRQE